MRWRNSGVKPAARTWLVQKVMASSSRPCQWVSADCPAGAWPGAGICSRALSRASVASLTAISHCASKPFDSTSRNSVDASLVSGVAGSNLRCSRSENSLAKALREEKPKSAKRVVPSSAPSSWVHQACSRSRVSGRACNASSSSSSRASVAGTERASPRSQSI